MKNKIAILVDSGTDVPQEIIDMYNIYVIPLKIIYKDREYTDKIDITPEEIYKRLPEEIPGTSLPDGESITKIFDQIKNDGYDKVLAITISSGLSGTNNVVRLVAQEQEGIQTHVLDTKNIGIGAGFTAIQAAKWIEDGMEWDTLIDELVALAERTKVFFNVATLEYLQKGGRIGLVASILGNALNLNPIISCNEEGIYYTVGKARGRKKSLDKTMSYVKEAVGDAKVFNLAVAHGAAEEEAIEMKARFEREFPNVQEIYFGQISPALVVHTGPGLLGIGVQILEP